MAKPFRYRFEWDPVKARQNVRKHGIAFERAATVFLDSEAISEFDEKHSDREDRWATLGLDTVGAVLVVCHTFDEFPDGARVRIVSARKATTNEIKQYRRT